MARQGSVSAGRRPANNEVYAFSLGSVLTALAAALAASNTKAHILLALLLCFEAVATAILGVFLTLCLQKVVSLVNRYRQSGQQSEEGWSWPYILSFQIGFSMLAEATMYFALAFDSRGTYRPSWTELLG